MSAISFLTIGCSSSYEPIDTQSESSLGQCPISTNSMSFAAIASPFVEVNQLQVSQLNSQDDFVFQLNSSFSQQIKEALSQGQTNISFNFPLKEDLIVTAFSKKVTITPESLLISGYILEDPTSYLSLVVRNDVIVGTIQYFNESYEIRYQGEELHRISLLENTEEKCHSENEDEDSDELQFAQEDIISIAANETIDIIVGYTQMAISQAGSKDAMLGIIDLSVMDTNIAFEESGVTHRVRMVASHQLSENFSDDTVAGIDALASPNDNVWDDMHTLGAQYGADQLSVYVHGSGNGILGASRTGARNGYFAVTRLGALSRFTFSHELAHNFGAQHNHGYENTQGRFGTIMRYTSFNRIKRFSNPNTPYNGQTTGTQSNNSASIIEANGARVASFRAAKTPPPPPEPPKPPVNEPPPDQSNPPTCD